MTATETQLHTDRETRSPTDAATPPATHWAQQFAALQARYPKIREPILVALHILMQNPNVALNDAKAQAALHGVRITAASVAAAERLLQRQTPPAVEGLTEAPKRPPATTNVTAAAPRRARVARPARAAQPALDVEALVRTTVERSRGRPTPRPRGCATRCAERSRS